MSRMTSHPLFRGLAPLVAIVFAAAAFAGDLPSRSSSASGVSLSVTPRSLAGPAWEFEVALNTHSQDLNDDLLKTAALAVGDGAGTAPTGWQGDGPGGHHRKGVLRFAALSPAPATIELRIQRQGELAPRVFRWTLR